MMLRSTFFFQPASLVPDGSFGTGSQYKDSCQNEDNVQDPMKILLHLDSGKYHM
jgi:hypothetical protein